MGVDSTIRPGDTVLHRPTGETWFIVRVVGDYVVPGGWPPTRGRTSDCELIAVPSETGSYSGCGRGDTAAKATDD